MNIYSLYDSKAQTFGAIAVFENDDIAIRVIGESIARAKDTPPAKYPSDFSVMRLGTWDNDKGITSVTKECVCTMIEALSTVARYGRENARYFAELYREFESQENKENENEN